jgi:DNA-binding transcriptional regulator of glucitol operon
MDNMIKLFFVFIGMMVVQGGMTFFQIKNYQTNAKEIRKIGDMLVGQAKGGIKPGCIVMMALDPDGNILETRCMLGRTVFHKFKIIHDFDGKNVFSHKDWVKKVKNEQLKKAINTAIHTMMDQLEAKKLDELAAIEDTSSTDSLIEGQE